MFSSLIPNKLPYSIWVMHQFNRTISHSFSMRPLFPKPAGNAKESQLRMRTFSSKSMPITHANYACALAHPRAACPCAHFHASALSIIIHYLYSFGSIWVHCLSFDPFNPVQQTKSLPAWFTNVVHSWVISIWGDVTVCQVVRSNWQVEFFWMALTVKMRICTPFNC